MFAHNNFIVLLEKTIILLKQSIQNVKALVSIKLVAKMTESMVVILGSELHFVGIEGGGIMGGAE